jgi:hypothetical protein
MVQTPRAHCTILHAVVGKRCVNITHMHEGSEPSCILCWPRMLSAIRGHGSKCILFVLEGAEC